MKNSWPADGNLLPSPPRNLIKPSSSRYRKSFARLTRRGPILFFKFAAIVHSGSQWLPTTSMHSKRVDGKFLGPGGVVPTSQAICSSLLEECFNITQEIKAQENSKHVAVSLKPIYDRLNGLRAELENLVLTHRWSPRETDLWNTR